MQEGLSQEILSHKAEFILSSKKLKLCTKGVVEWPNIDLTPTSRGRPRAYTEK